MDDRFAQASVGTLLVLAVLVAALPSAGAGAGEPSPNLPEDRVRGSFIVDLVDDLDVPGAAQAVAEVHGGAVAHVYDEVVGAFAFRGPDAAYEGLRRDPRVAQVSPDLPVWASVDRIPAGIRRIRARHRKRTAAHDLGVTGRGQRIAILDTGIDLDHPDLRVVPKHGRDCTGTGLNDVEGHGTHVAGTAAAMANNHGVVGMAPGAVVVPVKVLDNRGRGTMASVMCGVNHITRLKNDGKPGNDILTANMSLNGNGGSGHCDDGALRQSICHSVSSGIVYAASAGHSHGNVVKTWPANYPEVITVSGFTDFDGRGGGAAGCRIFGGRTECDDTLWSRTNQGPTIDVTAPAIFVLSDAAGGGIEVRSGTSQAAPHAAGLAALIRSLRGWNPKRVRNHMLATGECPDGNHNTRTGFCKGQGAWGNNRDEHQEPLLNALRAVRSLT